MSDYICDNCGKVRPQQCDCQALPDSCIHNWIDPTNEKVESGAHRICTRCGIIAIPTESPALPDDVQAVLMSLAQSDEAYYSDQVYQLIERLARENERLNSLVEPEAPPLPDDVQDCIDLAEALCSPKLVNMLKRLAREKENIFINTHKSASRVVDVNKTLQAKVEELKKERSLLFHEKTEDKAKIEELEKEIADLNHEYDQSVAHSAILLAKSKAKIKALQTKVEALEKAVNWWESQSSLKKALQEDKK